MELKETEELQMIESNLGFHTFTCKIAEKLVKFEVIKFKDSVFIWIGEKRNRTFGDLALALLPRNTKESVSTKIMGNPTDLTSSNIANKLSRKLNKPVYVSFNLVDDRLTVPIVNSRLAEEIQSNPGCF